MLVHLRPLAEPVGAVEIVERKGVGHPDSLVDALAEAFSARLCREYRRRFGGILHHNVDKALLIGGASAPALGGGRLLEPIELILAGRATVEVGGERVDVEGLAHEVVDEWIRAHLRYLDPAQHLRLQVRVRGGSSHLRDLFHEPGGLRCNDTSIGVGYAPLSPLEQAVLDVEERLAAPGGRDRHPAWGEDVKLMALRQDDRVELTVACAMVDRHLPDAAAYEEQRAALDALAREVLAARLPDAACRVAVNAGDDPARGRLYLTVTGTSAEGGDDGQVGRGNRVNGLITPLRPMSLEAAAGKNPVTHVGKLYNLVAGQVCHALVDELPEVRAARCTLVSRIGAPVHEPQLAELHLQLVGDLPLACVADRAEALLQDRLHHLERLTEALVEGRLPVC